MDVMGSISEVIAFLVFSFGLFFTGKELWEKTQVEKIFFTPKQREIHRFAVSTISAIYLSFLLGYFHILKELYIKKTEWDSLNWENLMANSLFWFIVFFIAANPLLKTIRYLFVPYTVKYKIALNDEDLYLIKMIDSDICICAENPSIDLDNASDEFVLLKKEDLINVKLKRVKVDKPIKNKVLQLVSARFYS